MRGDHRQHDEGGGDVDGGGRERRGHREPDRDRVAFVGGADVRQPDAEQVDRDGAVVAMATGSEATRPVS